MNKTPQKKQPAARNAASRPAQTQKPSESSFRSRLHHFNFQLRKQRLKYGTMATVMSLLIIAAIILANVLVGIGTDKYGLKFDMTSDRRFELSDETIDMLEHLDEKVSFYVFMTEDHFRAQTYGDEMTEILYRYEVYSDGMVEVEFVDPVRNPGFVKKYEDIVEISNGSIVVEKGERHRSFSLSDLYYWYDSTQSSVVGLSIERKLTTAIAYMNIENPPKAIVLTGHSEIGASTIASQLYEANYTVSTLNLLEGDNDIPDDVTLVVLCCPTTDYTEEEILKLEKYLATYRNFVYITGADAPSLTNLELLFHEWGVAFEDALVCDAGYRYSDYTNVYTFAASTDAAFTEGFSSSKYVVAPRSKVMKQLWTESGLISSVEVLQTSPESYAKLKNDSESITSYERTDGDLSGSFSAAIFVSRSQIINNQTKTTNLLFLSSPYLFTGELVNSDSFGNMRFMTNIFDEFNDSGVTVSVKSKRFTDPELEVIGNQLTVVLVLLCVIPAAIIIFGIVVWYRRKNR